MTLGVALFGVLVLALGALGVASPQRLLGLIEGVPAARRVPLAVCVRGVLGVVLLAAAPETRFPVAVRVLGAVALVAAVGIALMGSARFEAFLDWWRARPAGFVRAASLLAIAFGAFLVRAAT